MPDLISQLLMTGRLCLYRVSQPLLERLYFIAAAKSSKPRVGQILKSWLLFSTPAPIGVAANQTLRPSEIRELF